MTSPQPINRECDAGDEFYEGDEDRAFDESDIWPAGTEMVIERWGCSVRCIATSALLSLPFWAALCVWLFR